MFCALVRSTRGRFADGCKGLSWAQQSTSTHVRWSLSSIAMSNELSYILHSLRFADGVRIKWEGAFRSIRLTWC